MNKSYLNFQTIEPLPIMNNPSANIMNEEIQSIEDAFVLEIEQPIMECRNKRYEQARRKRLKRKNGSKNKVRWR